jgi:hypothetical protein
MDTLFGIFLHPFRIVGQFPERLVPVFCTHLFHPSQGQRGRSPWARSSRDRTDAVEMRPTLECPQIEMSGAIFGHDGLALGTHERQFVGDRPGQGCCRWHGQQQPRATRDVMPRICHHGIAGAEEDRVLKVDLAADRLGLPQRGGDTCTKPKCAVIRQNSRRACGPRGRAERRRSEARSQAPGSLVPLPTSASSDRASAIMSPVCSLSSASATRPCS